MENQHSFILGLFGPGKHTLLAQHWMLPDHRVSYLGSFPPATSTTGRNLQPLHGDDGMNLTQQPDPNFKLWDMWRAESETEPPIDALVRAEPDDAGIIFDTQEYRSDVESFRGRLERCKLVLPQAYLTLPGVTAEHTFKVAEIIWHQDGSFFALLRSNYHLTASDKPPFGKGASQYVLVFRGSEEQYNAPRGWRTMWKSQLKTVYRLEAMKGTQLVVQDAAV